MVEVVLDAMVMDERVEVIAESRGSSWKFGWYSDLEGKSIAYLFDKLKLGRLPPDFPDIDLKNFHVELYSFRPEKKRNAPADGAKGMCVGIAGLDFLYVSGKSLPPQQPPSCWGLVQGPEEIKIPTSDLVAKLVGDNLSLCDLHIGKVSDSFHKNLRNVVRGLSAQADRVLEDGALRGPASSPASRSRGSATRRSPCRSERVRQRPMVNR